MLGEAFENTLEELKIEDVGYEWFDFHEECKRMKWNNLSKLIDKIEPDLEKFGYSLVIVGEMGGKRFNHIKNIEIVKKQKGVIRTNCVDSLDRTGVVQSVIARNILHKELSEAELESMQIDRSIVFTSFENTMLEQTFRNSWADNGDQLSIQYSGTKAMKTDFTRTGNRTIMGVLSDCKNSMQRYYVGRFADGYYQDSLEFVAGTINPATEEIKERSFVSPVFMASATVIITTFRWLDPYLQRINCATNLLDLIKAHGKG